MNEKEFLYYIAEQDGRTARIINDVVTYLGQPAALPQTPDGWQEILIGWEKDMNTYGNVRNFSLPMGFVLDGAQILRDGLYRSNVDRKLYLIIQRRITEIDTNFYKTYYKFLYKGELDFSTMEDDQGEPKVTIKINEGGLQKLWAANNTTEYFIPFDADAHNILMDGIEFDQEAKFVIPGVEYIDVRQYFPALSFIGKDILSTQEIAVFTQNFGTYFGGPTYNFSLSSNYFFQTAKEVTIRIQASINVNLGSGGFFWIVGALNTATVPGGGVAGGVYYESAVLSAGVNVVNIDTTVTIPAGEKLFLHLNKPFQSNDTFTDTDFIITFKYTAPQTAIKAFPPYTLYKKLIEKITGSADNAYSLGLQESTYYVTSGDGIRGIEGAGIKTSLNDFFKAYNVYLMGGMAVEGGKILFQRRHHFFVTNDLVPAVNLGAAKNFKIRPAKEFMFSSIRVGHREQSIDDVNGKYDFNGYQIYTSPNTRETKQLDLQSPYKAGPYEIEIIRINLEGKTTTDSNSDNDVFVIDVNAAQTIYENILLSFVSSGNYIVFPGLDNPRVVVGQKFIVTGTASNDETYTVTGVDYLATTQTVHTDKTITVPEIPVSATVEFIEGVIHTLRRDIVVTAGVPSPATIFNVALSPHRLLLQHGPWLHGILSGYEPASLVFQSGNRNVDLIAGGIVEKSDIPINNLGAIMCRPYIFEFDTQVPISLVETLETVPNKDFIGTWGENQFEGFLLDAGLAPNTLQEQTYKLLAAPSVNILNFIKLPRNG